MKGVGALWVVHTILLLTLSVSGASTRLAIGTLGLTETMLDRDLGDLLVARLSAVPEFDLVERRELDRVLKEASLSLSGIVRAKDAVRFGTLLRVDQFLLGSSAPINGTNRLVIRLVNARTGVIEAIDVFRDTRSLDTLAGHTLRKRTADLFGVFKHALDDLAENQTRDSKGKSEGIHECRNLSICQVVR